MRFLRLAAAALAVATLAACGWFGSDDAAPKPTAGAAATPPARWEPAPVPARELLEKP